MSVDPDTGQIRLKRKLDREEVQEMALTLTCTFGTRVRQRDILLLVRDVNDNVPYITHHGKLISDEHISIARDRMHKNEVILLVLIDKEHMNGVILLLLQQNALIRGINISIATEQIGTR